MRVENKCATCKHDGFICDTCHNYSEYEEEKQIEKSCDTCTNRYCGDAICFGNDYSQWISKLLEEIKVGDEVLTDNGIIGIVVQIYDCDTVGVLYRLQRNNDIQIDYWYIPNLKKTGRCFPQITDVVNYLQEPIKKLSYMSIETEHAILCKKCIHNYDGGEFCKKCENASNYEKIIDNDLPLERECETCKFAFHGMRNGKTSICNLCALSSNWEPKDKNSSVVKETDAFDDIEVGDEVICKGTSSKKIVLRILDYGRNGKAYFCVGTTGGSTEKDPTKTGRHFPIVKEIIKEMEG